MKHNLKTISTMLVRFGLKTPPYTFKDLTKINSEVEATIEELQQLKQKMADNDKHSENFRLGYVLACNEILGENQEPKAYPQSKFEKLQEEAENQP